MSTCRSCINWDKCVKNNNTRYYSDNIAANNVEELCKWFTNTKEYLKIPEAGIGELSDGYHTFNELYHHRAILFSAICNIFSEKAWKSKKHDTGEMFDGMFIVGIKTPEGQATYHYDIETYWDMFKVKELPRAPKWDGHTPEEAINRISKLINKHATWRLETDEECSDPMFKLVICSNCEEPANNSYKFCPHCGSSMIPKVQFQSAKEQPFEQLTFFAINLEGLANE